MDVVHSQPPMGALSPSFSSLDILSPSRRIKRKPAPRISIAERYPPPDPNDPFATLKDLRRRCVPDSVSTRYGGLRKLGGQCTRANSPKVASFQLFADPPPLLSDWVTSDGESSSSPRSPPPKSPLRYSQSIIKSHSASNILALAGPVQNTGHISRQNSEPLPLGPGDYTSKCRGSPAPSLVHDAGHSDSSSDVDGALPSPVFPPDPSILISKENSTSSGKKLHNFMGRNRSSSHLLGLFQSSLISENNAPSLPSPPSQRPKTTCAHFSPDETLHSAPEPPCEVYDRATIFDQTLAILSGLESSPPSPDDKTFPKPKARKLTWSFFDDVDCPGTQPRNSISSSSGSSTDHSCSSIDDHVITGSMNPPHGDANEATPLTSSQLTLASCIPVIDCAGERLPFASLFGNTKVHVIFVRHWACVASQSYIREVVQHLSTLSAHDLATTKAVVIGNGSPTLIEKYRRTCDIPDCIAIYAEPSLRIHRALGFGMATEKEVEMMESGTPKKGHSFAKVVARALKSSAHHGPTSMLGGAFRFGPGVICSYSHQMSGLNDYAPLEEFLPLPSPATPQAERHFHLEPVQEDMADIAPESDTYDSEINDVLCDLQATSPTLTDEEKAEWMQNRVVGMDRMRNRKHARRALGTTVY